ncbi:unnamed protein product [Polarella glacialis]|uniref:Uncharacterized protein n=1 Tax=Polarella glacialis TaxID=89957 RepID=A0A813HZN2_POLGL|nr:unnamed protein product [Polarella glacialis]
MELGWTKWSLLRKVGRVRMLKRLLLSTNGLTQCLLQCTANMDGSWAQISADMAKLLSPAGLPTDLQQWNSLVTHWQEAAKDQSADELVQECVSHQGLSHYQPSPWTDEGQMGVNRLMHHVGANATESLELARLLAGGGGLRGGDPRSPGTVTPRTACMIWLLNGRRERETLEHFVYRCPGYDELRQRYGLRRRWESAGPAVVRMSRSSWPWTAIHATRTCLVRMLARRRAAMQGLGGAKRRKMEERAHILWAAAERQ